jgi:allantoin permease
MEHQRKLFQQRGYSEDLLPKTQSQRTWKTFNYFTLWMGSVHNVPNYVMVGGFFILGLSTFSIMLAIILSAFFIAAVMVLNGAAGSKYGVPFAMILRASYGVRGALFPGLLRGGIAAIMWFGLQCYAGSLACLILIGIGKNIAAIRLNEDEVGIFSWGDTAFLLQTENICCVSRH